MRDRVLKRSGRREGAREEVRMACQLPRSKFRALCGSPNIGLTWTAALREGTGDPVFRVISVA